MVLLFVFIIVSSCMVPKKSLWLFCLAKSCQWPLIFICCIHDISAGKVTQLKVPLISLYESKQLINVQECNISEDYGMRLLILFRFIVPLLSWLMWIV